MEQTLMYLELAACICFFIIFFDVVYKRYLRDFFRRFKKSKSKEVDVHWLEERVDRLETLQQGFKPDKLIERKVKKAFKKALKEFEKKEL